MQKNNITIVGPIGSGKTEIVSALNRTLSNTDKKVIVQLEPSVTISHVNELLKNFYKDPDWAYSLQLTIASAQEAFMESLRKTDYDYALVDAAFSSNIYGYSHWKNKRISRRQFEVLCNIAQPFKFDTLIWLDLPADIIKRNIETRNKEILETGKHGAQDDVPIDLGFIENHIKEFQEYKDEYFKLFEEFNPNIDIIELNKIPNKNTETADFNKFIECLTDIVKKDEYEES